MGKEDRGWLSCGVDVVGREGVMYKYKRRVIVIKNLIMWEGLELEDQKVLDDMEIDYDIKIYFGVKDVIESNDNNVPF